MEFILDILKNRRLDIPKLTLWDNPVKSGIINYYIIALQCGPQVSRGSVHLGFSASFFTMKA